MMSKESLRIIIFNMNWIGDILFSTPAISAIRNFYPTAHMTCIVPPNCEELLAGNPSINEVLSLKTTTLSGKAKLFRKIYRRFDIGFLFHRSRSRALLFYLAKIPTRIGFDTKNRAKWLTQATPLPKQKMHKADQLLYLLEKSGIPPVKRQYEFSPSRPPSPMVSNIFRDFSNNIVFHPGANWSPKRWPTGHFALLGMMLRSQGNTRPILITGTKEDKPLAQEIVHSVGEKCFDLTGQTTLTDLSHIFQRAAVVIAGDTGALHLAIASGAKVLALYGPTSPALCGPLNRRTPILQAPEGNLEFLSPETVWHNLKKLSLL